jgi:hypothetical protein
MMRDLAAGYQCLRALALSYAASPGSTVYDLVAGRAVLASEARGRPPPYLRLPSARGCKSRNFLTRRLVPRLLDLGTKMVTWQIPAHWRDVRRRPRYGRFMSARPELSAWC